MYPKGINTKYAVSRPLRSITITVTSALLRGSPSPTWASVLRPCETIAFGRSLNIPCWVPVFPLVTPNTCTVYEVRGTVLATYTPDAVQTVNRMSLALVPKSFAHFGFDIVYRVFDASSVVPLRSTPVPRTSYIYAVTKWKYSTSIHTWQFWLPFEGIVHYQFVSEISSIPRFATSSCKAVAGGQTPM